MAMPEQWKGTVPDRATTGSPLMGDLAATWRSWLWKVLLIAGLVIGIYAPAFHGDFIWDDQWYVTINPLTSDPHGLWKFWFSPGTWVEYYPIQETVLWLQYHFWGENTLGYHLTNVFLHIINALLVWWLFAKMRLRFAWVGGLIFAVHPVQVESVAYISELKNVLSLPCGLLAMGAWIDYEESQSRHDYNKALGLYIVAMLCKISLAPFAAIILLYAWWKRGRITWGDVKACLPFLLIAMVLGYLTIWSGIVYNESMHAQIGGTPLTGLMSRIDAAGLNAAVYFSRCFAPVEIMMVYPQWPLHPGRLMDYAPWFGLLIVIAVSWARRRTWGKHVALGFGFFIVFLLPFLGLKSVSYMNFIWVLDHFLYLPIIGIIGLFIAGMEGLSAQIPPRIRPLAAGLVAVAVALMVVGAHQFAGLFVNEETLWAYILARNPTVWLAHDDLACKYLEEERYPEAIEQARESLKIRPDSWNGYFTIGFAMEKLGRKDEAAAEYRTAIHYNPDAVKAYLFLGEIRRKEGKIAEAESIFRAGLKVAPEDESLNTNLAGILFETGRIPEAIEVYQRISQLNPDMAQLHYDLGNALLKAGRVPEAAGELKAAVDLNPKVAAAHGNLGATLAQLGQLPAAMEQFEAALLIDSSLNQVRDNMARALAQSGRIPEAIEQFRLVLQADPNDANARDSLEKLQQLQMQQAAPAKNP
jgi:tetratricopeptide (TPR) repeat protein